MRRIYINGKFYAGGLNGVHRVADRLIRELDIRLQAMPASTRPDVVLLAPVKRKWAPQISAIRLVEEARGHSQLWEQFILPWRARDGVLLNLCNLAPVLHRDKILLLHDAQFLFPDSSYPARLRWGYRLLTPIMARTSRLVLTVSEYSRQMLDVLGVSPRAKTGVVHNGANHLLDVPSASGFIDRLGLTAKGYVVHIASHKAYKNTGVVFQAFAGASLANLPLVLVGETADRLANAGLTPPPNAVFTGRIDDSELRALYENALCLVFPSRTEGFGLPPVEAGLLGCPSVVSPGGAIPEVCRDAALYAQVDEPDEWVAGVLAYASDAALRQSKVDLIATRAQQLSWAAAGERLSTILFEGP